MKRMIPLILVLTLQAGSALAHAGLVSTVPAEGATVAAPETIVLTFNEPVSATLSGVQLLAADGSVLPTGAAVLSKDKVTLTIPLTAPLAAGAYTADWHALSDDGHKVHGSFTFTVQ